MANLFNLDFNAAKTAIKTFISGTDDFKDYNFEGSAINNLLDVLAHFTEKYSFYLNNVANEMFIGTAQNPDNVYKLANMLNYLPSRKVSPTITISLTRIGSDNIHIPKYSKWTMGSLKLTNLSDIDITDGATHEFTLNEGTVVTETFTSDGTAFQTFALTEREKVDNDNLFVYVDTPDGLGSFTLGTENWLPVNLGELNTSGNNYYINYFDTMDIRFDDGSVYTKPAENDRIRIIYNTTAGATNNGSSGAVTLDNTVLNAKLTVTNPNSDVLINGVAEESVIAIQTRAPGVFAAQGRTVTQSDYDNLIKSYGSYDLFNDVKIWGGETEWINALNEIVREVDGVQRDLGHVYLSALKATTYDYLTKAEQDGITDFLNNKKFLTIFFRFLHPNIVELTPSVSVKYKSTILPNFEADLIADINTYLDGLEGFDGVFNQSNLDQYIDSQDNVEYMSSSVTSKVQAKSGAEFSSTATGGTAFVLIDSSLIDVYDEDYFQSYHLHHLTGANSPQTMMVAGFTPSTGTIIFAEKLTLVSSANFTIGGVIQGDSFAGNTGYGIILDIIGNDVYVKTLNGGWTAPNGVDNVTPWVGDETTISSVTTYLVPASTDTYNIIDYSDYNAIRLNQSITSGSISETIATPSTLTTWTASSGSTTTLVDTVNLKNKYKDDYWNGHTIQTIAFTGLGQTLTVTDYDDDTGTLTFATATTALDGTTTYRLEGTLVDSVTVDPELGDLTLNGVSIGLVDYTDGWVTYTHNFALDNIQIDFTFDSTLALAFNKETFLKYTDLTSITAL